MVYDYVVTLKNERARHINTVSVILAGTSALVFLYQQIRSGKPVLILSISFILLTGGLLFNWYRTVKKAAHVNYSRILLVAGVTWFAMPVLQWMGFPFIILALLEKQAKFSLEIGFTPDQIVFNSLFKRRFPWNDFSNILLKDGLLTLDFKNNRLFQKQTIDEDDDADEDEFNEYCRRHLQLPGSLTN